ncbi:MAG: protein phosphatase 2C domain-containing protein [Marinobacter sp.]|nr:protein phosphatase 2C domain-containing protein [Marinobacter sp.]
MALKATGLTHEGCKRSSNQDSIAWQVNLSGTGALGILADGMGGYEGGEIASRLAVDTLMASLAPELDQPHLDDQTIAESIQSAIALAGTQIRRARDRDERLNKMGTTVVLAWVRGDRAHIAHLGDSRCYLLSGPHLSCQTRDDTVVQNMIEDGSINEADASRVPFRNVLTRALGSADDAPATLTSLTMATGDRLILCSDGLTGAVPDETWPDLLANRQSLADQAQHLLDTSLDNEASDNVSVVLIQLGD